MHQYLSRKSAAPLLPLALLGCAVLLMSYSEIASRAAQNAMKLCAAVIIPSLFPYMVISSLLVLSGAAAEMGGWFSRPVRHLFRLPDLHIPPDKEYGWKQGQKRYHKRTGQPFECP